MNNEVQKYIDTVFNNKHLNPLKKHLYDNKYMCIIVKQGCLLDDEMWIHPDTVQSIRDNMHNPKYIFIFKEKYLNDWSSTQTHRKYKELPKKYYKFIDIDK